MDDNKNPFTYWRYPSCVYCEQQCRDEVQFKNEFYCDEFVCKDAFIKQFHSKKKTKK